jgi:hypothetical protein
MGLEQLGAVLWGCERVVVIVGGEVRVSGWGGGVLRVSGKSGAVQVAGFASRWIGRVNATLLQCFDRISLWQWGVDAVDKCSLSVCQPVVVGAG